MTDKKDLENKDKSKELKELKLKDILIRGSDKKPTPKEKAAYEKEMQELNQKAFKEIQAPISLDFLKNIKQLNLSNQDINLFNDQLAKALQNVNKQELEFRKKLLKTQQSISGMNLTNLDFNIPKYYLERLNLILDKDYSRSLKKELHGILSTDIDFVYKTSLKLNEQYKWLIYDLPNQLESFGINDIQIDISQLTQEISNTNPFNYLDSNQLLDSALIDIEKLTSLALYDYENKLRELTSSLNFPSVQEYNDFIENQLFKKKYLETKALKAERKTHKEKENLKEEISKRNAELINNINNSIQDLKEHSSELVANENIEKINDYINTLKTKQEAKDKNNLTQVNDRVRRYKHHDLFIEIIEHLAPNLGQYPKNVYNSVKLEIKKEYEKKLKNTRYPKPNSLYREPKYKNSVILTHITNISFYWDKNATESDVTKLNTEPKGTSILWTTLKQTLSNKKDLFLKEIIENHKKV